MRKCIKKQKLLIIKILDLCDIRCYTLSVLATQKYHMDPEIHGSIHVGVIKVIFQPCKNCQRLSAMLSGNRFYDATNSVASMSYSTQNKFVIKYVKTSFLRLNMYHQFLLVLERSCIRHERGTWITAGVKHRDYRLSWGVLANTNSNCWIFQDGKRKRVKCLLKYRSSLENRWQVVWYSSHFHWCRT